METHIQSQKIPNGVKNDLIKTIEKRLPEVPPHLFKLHHIMAFVGACNSGKTNAAIQYVKSNLDHHCFNHVFLMSPTAHENRAFDVLEIKHSDKYGGKDVISRTSAILESIINKIENLGDEYEQNEIYKAAFKAWKAGKTTLAQQTLLYNNNYRIPENIPLPCCALILDDLSHSELYSTSKSNPFINLALRHRHVGNVGLSIYLIVQNFKGLPKVLRQNTKVFNFWKTHDQTQIDAIYEEAAKICDEEAFLSLYHHATKEPHCFLCLNTAEEDPTKQFRKNFDEYIFIGSTPTQPTQPYKRRKHG